MLELTSVVKTYKTKAGDTAALNDVNITFGDTGLVFITGKSGSGKTTLLNVIGGLDGIDSGEISINGKDFSNFTPAEFDSYRNTFIGFIFQEYNLLSEYSVGKNVEIANELQGKKTEESEVDALFEQVDIAGMQYRKTSQLSGGQKQRVAIARALIKNPKIIMADEPTGALDSATGKQIISTLKELSKEKLVIVVSHDLELAEKYADRIIRLVDGRVVEDVSLTNVEVKGNVFETEEELTVRVGSDLDKQETEKLVGAVKSNKKISFTNKISVRERKKTKEPKKREISEEEKSAQLINSKMKFSSAFHLGLKAVFIKPVRLIFTILLSVIAFAVFGVFDAIASYDNAVAIASIINEGEYNAISTTASYYSDDYYGMPLKFSDNQINNINKKTGYKFRGVYELDDEEVIYDSPENPNRRFLNKTKRIDNMPGTASYNFNYYTREVTGLLPFSQEEIENIYDEDNILVGQIIDKNGFNLKSVAGEFPTKTSVDGVAEVAISKYMAESAVYWSKRYGQPLDGKVITQISDVIGVKFKISGVGEYLVKGIFDCGEIPAKYDKLKQADIGSSDQEKDDFTTYIHSGCELLFFVLDEYVDNLRASNGRAINYVYDNYAVNYSATYADTRKSSLYYYSTEDVQEDKIGIYSEILGGEDRGELKANELLVHENYFKEMHYATITLALNSEFGGDFRTQLRIFEDSDNISERKEALKYMMQKMMEISNSTSYQNIFEKTIKIKGEAREANPNDAPVFYKEMTIVGVYFDVDTDVNMISSKFAPFMVSKAGLKNLEVYTNQGIYSRIITPDIDNVKGAKALGRLMDTDSGLKLNWYENSVLDVIENNKELLSGFINLFLIIALVLLVFSIFMLYNYISTSIMSKKQSVGVLRALGANSKNILYMFLTESMLISILSGLLACVVAFVSCIFVNGYVVEVLKLSLSIAQYGIRQILIILGGSIFAGILSSIIPIIKVIKKKPVELIRKV